MLFNSLSYLVFLPIVFLLYWAIPPKHRWALLLCASYYFYMSWNVTYVSLILFTTVISYLCALLLERAKTKAEQKLYLTLTLLFSLGVLFVYKYFNFFFESLGAICKTFAIPLQPITLTLLLPVGISFYTFQTLSYVIDVYRGDTPAEHHFGKYATFVSFFPQLVAGPIERSPNLLTQINQEHVFCYDTARYGMQLIVWGMFKKVWIADFLAQQVNLVYNNLPTYEGFALVIAAVFFTLQIYCDFSGYSDIAIGSANLFGFQLMTNFNSPYFSTSVADFWSRWHISLSTWFRDYLYIPLGGNRCSKVRHSFNLLLTFMVSGLWHGANITFILWGGVHGLFQILENIFFKKRSRNAKNALTPRKLLWWGRCALMFAFCSATWVLFRAQNVGEIGYIFTHLFTGITNPIAYVWNGIQSITDLRHTAAALCSVLLLFTFDFIQLTRDPIALLGKQPLTLRWGVYMLFTFWCFVTFPALVGSDFIYFQF